MMELFQFQEAAAATVSDRFIEYLDDPPQAGTAKHPRTVPFFQALSALTGAGKTLILAEAVSQVAATMPVPPVILWLSRGRVVVRQSFANLSPGGKYHSLLDNITVMALGDYDATDAAQSNDGLLCFATVGTFNQRDREKSNLTIFGSDIDNAEQSIWNALKLRVTGSGSRRPLLVVYDEAHNLSDQQTELLLELEPDGFLLASATMRLPARLNVEVEDLKRRGWPEDRLITVIDTAAVVAENLVKGTLDLAGYNAPMEETISNLLTEMRLAEDDAAQVSPAFKPKAIYVCNTNMVADDAHLSDDPRQPFEHRQAPPILIWRYLVEQCGIDPREIAVYADLKTAPKDFPLPADFVLFKGADTDYDQFTAGSYRHVIFNLGLQEGWDDPEVYFAYVDKSMDSPVQVTQVIGRVLRQPNATHFPYERLNTAHFYVRVDRNETFNDVLSEVEKQLGGTGGGVKIIATPPGKQKPQEYPPRMALAVPMTGLDGSSAQTPIQTLMSNFTDYRQDDLNTRGQGSRKVSRQRLGGSSEAGEWEVFEQASRVSARWIFHREVQRRYRDALNVVNLADPKLNAIVGMGSPAFSAVRDLAERVVRQYVDDVRLVQRGPNPHTPASVLARPDELHLFKNAVHAGYSGLNPTLELPFAQALDDTGLPWCRNPPRTGYGIGLVTIGPTQTFYPDFLVWTSKRVICIDTKGGFLVRETAGRKLLMIRKKEGAERSLDVQFVTKGRWSNELEQEAPDGYTRWGLNDEGRIRARFFDGLAPLLADLTRDDA